MTEQPPALAPLPEDLRLLSTVLYTACSFFLVDLHYARLEKSCRNLGWAVPKRQDVDRALYSCIIGQAHLTLRIRLLCDSDGKLEAQAFQTEVQKNILGSLSTRIHEHSAFGDQPDQAASWQVLLDTESISVDERLLLNKTTQRSHYEQPVKRLQTSYAALQEVLLYNDQRQITECTITSVAFRRNGLWTTPRTESGCLPGVMRQYLLDKGLIVEGDIKLDELQDGEPLLLFNGLRGVLDAYLSIGKSDSSR